MEKEVVETVLKDVLEELKLSNQLIEDLVGNVKEVGMKVDTFQKQLSEIQVLPAPVDTKPLQAAVQQGLHTIARTIEGQPKSVIRQFRLLLFPETNAEQYYRIVFGRLIPWSLLFVGCFFVFNLVEDYIASSERVDTARYNYEQYEKAWNRLDSALEALIQPKAQKIIKKALERK